VKIEFSGNWAASASETTAGYLIIISQMSESKILLQGIKLLEFRGRISTFLKDAIKNASGLDPLDPLEARKNVSSEWGALMTQHLFEVHRHFNRDPSDVVADTAWKYSTLVAWGEASAARELSLRTKTSVHTIHYRLKLARDKGILKSPGPGSRLGGQ
jgi:hypothetical protein